MRETHYCVSSTCSSAYFREMSSFFCTRLLWSDQPYQNDVAPVLNLSPNLVSKERHR